MFRIARKRQRDERGAEAVEFALIALPFMILLLGMIQYGFYFWTAETTNSAAREAARRVVVGDCWDNAQLTNYVTSQAPRASGVTVSPGTFVYGETVTVTVTADAEILGFLPLPNGGTVTRTYDARMETSQQSAAADDLCSTY